MMRDNEKYRDYMGRILEAVESGDTDTKLGRVLARWRDHDFTCWRDGKWLYESFVSYFKMMAETLSAIDPSVSPDVPPHLLDPAQIADYFGIPLEEFNWAGPNRQAAVATALLRIEEKLDHSLSELRQPNAEYVSIKEAAALTGLSYSFVYKAVLAGEIPASNVGTARHRVYRIARTDLTAWMQTKKGGTTVPPKSEVRGLIDRYFG